MNNEPSKDIVNKNLEITPTVINGTLSFKSIDEFQRTSKFLANLSLAERTKWEEKIGFYSLKRRVEEGFAAIQAANEKESLVELNKALQEFKDVIAENDTSYYKIYPSTPYQLICNRNGLYISLSHVYKVKPQEVEVYKIEDLNNLNNGLQMEPIKIFKNYYNKIKLDAKTIQTSVLTAEYFDNPSGCRSDRRCYVQLEDIVVYTDWITTDPEGYEYTIMAGTVEVFVSAWGTQRNWLCKWSRYSTLLAFRNVSFNVYGFQNSYMREYPSFSDIPYTNSSIVSYSGTIPDFAPPNDATEIYDLVVVGHCIVNENSIYNELINNYLGFILAHAEATSRGIYYNENWAIIDQ